MAQIWPCYLILIWFVLMQRTGTRKINALNGKHLRVFAQEFPLSLWTVRNATGHVINSGGILKEHLVVLSNKLNFSYSFLPVQEQVTENAATEKGSIYFLIRQEADYLLSIAIATPSRYRRVDFPTYWFIGPFSFIIPYPKSTTNLMASLEIFTYEVWLVILAAVSAMIVYLRYSSRQFQTIRSQSKNKKTIIRPVQNSTEFVLGNLLSQGQRYGSNSHLVIRFAAGAWCLGCFFIVQIYSTTLISHLMSPNQKPIVNSFHDIANTPGFSLTAVKDFGIDLLLQNMQIGDYKKLADKFRNQPDLLCKKTSDCLKRLRDDGNVAYGDSLEVLKKIMNDDLKVTGSCRYYLLKEGVLTSAVHTLLQKNSPYTETISMMILEFHQNGLLDEWMSWNLPNPRQCMQLIKYRDKDLRRLSLSHLSSAFVILGIGYSLSFFVFVVEKIMKYV